jgi:hypothetical protein
MRFRMSAGALSLGILLAGCGSSTPAGFHPHGQAQPLDAPSGALPSTTSVTAPPTTMTKAQVNQSVLGAYRQYQKVYEQVFATGDTTPLAAVATEPALSLIENAVAGMKAKGEVWRFHNVLTPEIQGRSADDGTVVVLDCLDTLGAFRFSATTGAQIGPVTGAGAFLYQTIMEYADGTWKVSSAKQGRSC